MVENDAQLRQLGGSAARRVGPLPAGQVRCLPTSIRIDKLIADADIRLSADHPLPAFIRLHAMLGAHR